MHRTMEEDLGKGRMPRSLIAAFLAGAVVAGLASWWLQSRPGRQALPVPALPSTPAAMTATALPTPTQMPGTLSGLLPFSGPVQFSEVSGLALTNTTPPQPGAVQALPPPRTAAAPARTGVIENMPLPQPEAALPLPTSVPDTAATQTLNAP